MTLTPEQFNKLATKDDLGELERKMEDKLDKRIDDVLTAVDGLAKNVKDFQAELASNQSAHDRFEYRISKLESKESIVRDEKNKE